MRATRREAVGLLRARQCADGGWNFGNASVYDVDLRGYAQTTAMGLIALQQGHARVVARAFGFLAEQLAPRARRADRRAGARRVPAPRAPRRACPSSSPRWSRSRAGPSFRERPLAVAWAALATGPDALLEPLRSRA